MILTRTIGLAVIAVLFATACGPDKPAETPPPADPGAPAATNTSAPAGSAAPSTSSEVTKGIQAMNAGDMNGARSLFEIALQKNPKQADAHYYLGLVLEQTGDKPSAEKHYKEALASQPDLAEAAANLIAIQVEAQRFDEAIAVGKKAVAANNKNAELELNYASALAGKNDQDGATKAFEEALRLKPTDVRFYLTYGHQLAEWKKRDAAVAQFAQAQKLVTDDPSVLASIGFELKNVHEWKDCITMLDRAIAQKDIPEIRVYRGQCKHGGKDLPGAITDFQAAIAKDSTYAPAHYQLGNAYADGSKWKDAQGEYESCLKLAPSGPLAKAADAKLKIVKDKQKK